MLKRIKVIDIELSEPIKTITELNGYLELKAVVHFYGEKIGEIYFPVTADRVEAVTLGHCILDQYREIIIRRLLRRGLEAPNPNGFHFEDLLTFPLSNSNTELHLMKQPDEIWVEDMPKHRDGVAVRTVELSQVIHPITDATDYYRARLYITWHGSPLGYVDITHYYQCINVDQIQEAIVNHIFLKLIEPNRKLSEEIRQAKVLAALVRHFIPSSDASCTPVQLLSDISVSIIVGTFDRPNELRNCLLGLTSQETDRSVEIIVVDNHPISQLTPPIVSEFPNVKLINETRQGVAYARNAGIVASSGEIIVTVDDDVTVPPGWLEKLLAPFVRMDVMAVTGNVLPLELKTKSQWLFEQYGNGGLGRGFRRFEVNGTWFDWFQNQSVPTWELGGTANSAYRACLFNHPEIGLMNEALGPGMPSGVGEDIYLFYKILKARMRIAYEPKAYVWHQHRCDMAALRRQIYNYSKGYVSYQLTTLFRDGDLRVVKDLAIKIPLFRLKQIYWRLRGWTDYPLSLVLVEIIGNLAGPWSLARSHQRVKREGCSVPYIPVEQRSDSQMKLNCHVQTLNSTKAATASTLTI